MFLGHFSRYFRNSEKLPSMFDTIAHCSKLCLSFESQNITSKADMARVTSKHRHLTYIQNKIKICFHFEFDF